MVMSEGSQTEDNRSEVQSKIKVVLNGQCFHVPIHEFPAGLVFYTKSTSGEDSRYEFILAAHSFMTLTLNYEDEAMEAKVQAFDQEISLAPRSNISAVPEVSFELTMLLEALLKDKLSNWRISTLNHDFLAFITAANVSDSVLRHAARFRSRGRLPILSYLREDDTALFRSSQALVGLQRHRSVQDERLIQSIRELSPRKMLLIVDARPSKSAMANVVTGAGFMPLEHYDQCTRVYLGIENIHAVRQSYLRIHHLMATGVGERAAKLEAGWIGHFERIMEGVKIITDHLKDGISVLVHCSDGWDRTAQLVSLTQICLNPATRTIHGLCALLQREWVAAGHQFDLRLGRALPLGTLSLSHKKLRSMLNGLAKSATSEEAREKEHGKDEFCPVFPQFLDCLRQLLRVYPTAFEFRDTLIDDLWIEAFLAQTDTLKGSAQEGQIVSLVLDHLTSRKLSQRHI